MAGTASYARIWIAVEHPGPWSAHAVTDTIADFPVPEGIRIVLIRRSRSTAGRVFISDPQSALVHLAEVDHVRDIAHWDFASIGAGNLPGVPTAERPVLVCTNGRRDQCCAIAGRALLRACADELLWECTHLGGHRFSPIVLRLSDGFMFGRVTVPDLRGILAGNTPIGCARGRTSLTPALQAAEIALLSHGIEVCGVPSLTSDPLAVQVQTPRGPVTVRVREESLGLMRPESCGGELRIATQWHCFVQGVD